MTESEAFAFMDRIIEHLKKTRTSIVFGKCDFAEIATRAMVISRPNARHGGINTDMIAVEKGDIEKMISRMYAYSIYELGKDSIDFMKRIHKIDERIFKSTGIHPREYTEEHLNEIKNAYGIKFYYDPVLNVDVIGNIIQGRSSGSLDPGRDERFENCGKPPGMSIFPETSDMIF